MVGVWGDIAMLSRSLFAVLEGKETRHERLEEGGGGWEGVGEKTYESGANHADEGGVVVEVFRDVFRPPGREETHRSMLQGRGKRGAGAGMSAQPAPCANKSECRREPTTTARGRATRREAPSR